VGTLTVGLRRGESELHDADRQALELIGTPLAVALHATALTEQVQQARIATVEAGAAERVRLQRELHDGLGPALTSLTFTADAASNLLRSDPAQAERMLSDVRTELRVALDNVRRVVYGLRPIELDDLGLIGALRQRVSTLSPAEQSGIRVHLDLPDELPPLSPAAELAAYRIVNEALANVFRHSAGAQCQIRLAADTELMIMVSDDGPPPRQWSAGVGLHSIVDRAEEVGGSASAGPADEGWQVSARLPLSGARANPPAAG
jgi:signal transduction histidine kinase